MDWCEEAVKLSSEVFRKLFGVKKEIFDVMVEVLCVVYAEKQSGVGMLCCFWRLIVCGFELLVAICYLERIIKF